MRPQHGSKIHVKAADSLRWLQIYSPSVDTGFVCVEPVNHIVDAQNNVGKLGMVCPQWLENDESLSVTCLIEQQELWIKIGVHQDCSHFKGEGLQ